MSKNDQNPHRLDVPLDGVRGPKGAKKTPFDGDPRALWRVGRLARTANLSAELEQLKQRRMPVVILWGDSDRLIPLTALDSLRDALHDPQVRTVPGSHSWLLADPDGFAEVMTNVLALVRPEDDDGPAVVA